MYLNLVYTIEKKDVCKHFNQHFSALIVNVITKIDGHLYYHPTYVRSWSRRRKNELNRTARRFICFLYMMLYSEIVSLWIPQNKLNTVIKLPDRSKQMLLIRRYLKSGRILKRAQYDSVYQHVRCQFVRVCLRRVSGRWLSVEVECGRTLKPLTETLAENVSYTQLCRIV